MPEVPIQDWLRSFRDRLFFHSSCGHVLPYDQADTDELGYLAQWFDENQGRLDNAPKGFVPGPEDDEEGG